MCQRVHILGICGPRLLRNTGPTRSWSTFLAAILRIRRNNNESNLRCAFSYGFEPNNAPKRGYTDLRKNKRAQDLAQRCSHFTDSNPV